MFIMIIREFYNGMVVKKQIVEGYIYSFISILFTSLFHHSRFAYATSTSDHYEPVAPGNGIIQIATKRSIKILYQTSGYFIYSFHTYIVFTKLQKSFFTKKENGQFLFFTKKKLLYILNLAIHLPEKLLHNQAIID